MRHRYSVPEFPQLGHTWFGPFLEHLLPCPSRSPGFYSRTCSGPPGSTRGEGQGHPLSHCPPCWAQGQPCQLLGTWQRGWESSISIPSWHQPCLSLPAPFCSGIAPCRADSCLPDSCPSISTPDGSPRGMSCWDKGEGRLESGCFSPRLLLPSFFPDEKSLSAVVLLTVNPLAV